MSRYLHASIYATINENYISCSSFTRALRLGVRMRSDMCKVVAKADRKGIRNVCVLVFIELLAFSNWIRRTGEDSRKFNNFYCFFSLSRDVLHLAQSYRKRESGFGLVMESFITEVKIEIAPTQT